VYRAYHDLNVQADWVRVEDIDQYDLLYLPIPVMLSSKTVERIRSWVERGGMLVSEGCPGYFGDGGRVDTRQPGLGLDQLFGAREAYVEFTPDLLDDLVFTIDGRKTRGGVFLQAYKEVGATPVGWYGDGRIAALDHSYGRGKTRLLGTMVGYGYAVHAGEGTSQLFSDLLSWAGKVPDVTSSDPRIKARLHCGAGGTYLWVANPARQAVPVRLEVDERWGELHGCQSLWGAEGTVDAGNVVRVTAGARDVAVLALEVSGGADPA
jgi:beta-galactosidase